MRISDWGSDVCSSDRMKARKGSIPDLAAATVAAGCDLALNCWGRMDDMAGIAGLRPDIGAAAKARLDRAMASRRALPDGPPLEELIATRDALLAMAPA